MCRNVFAGPVSVLPLKAAILNVANKCPNYGHDFKPNKAKFLPLNGICLNEPVFSKLSKINVNNGTRPLH